MTSGWALAADERAALASFVHAQQATLIASIVESAALAEPRLRGVLPFARSLLARFCLELSDGDSEPLDRLTASAPEQQEASELGRVAVLACAVVSKAYVAEYPGARAVEAYLALRSNEFEKRFRNERTKDRAEAADVSPYANTSEIVTSLLSALEARDGTSCDHSRAVGMWGGRLAKTIGLSAREQAFAVLAGTLIDVGKIATPTELLLKPGPLTSGEREVMRSHSSIGARMLERVPSLREFAPVVRAHHERFDGQGYPDRLSGTSIPMMARVLAVSDSFHAMISKRPYRAPIAVANAARELRRCSGTQWDPGVVDAMLSIVEPAVRTEPARAVGAAR